MKRHRFQADIFLPRSLEEVFSFFSDARNLETLTPPWLHFEILTPTPVEMGAGTMIDYRLRLHGLPLRWRSEVTLWEPPQRFVDEQRRGPYRLWIHEHTFAPGDGGTWVRDRIDYAIWGGAFVQRLLVAPDLERIFDYRHKRLLELFGKRG